MFCSITSGALVGVGSYLVRVETDMAPGLPCMDLIGCLSREAREARDRVRVALKNSDISLPPLRITINLSPADMPKTGTGFDLPIALGILRCLDRLPEGCTDDYLILGELGLSGEVRPVSGVLPIVLGAVKQGISRFILPAANASEVAILEHAEIYGVTHISEAMGLLDKSVPASELLVPHKNWEDIVAQDETDYPDFADVRGQESVKRAAEICAAGFHHMLLVGPPGSGKTMLARRLPSILPPLSFEESLEVSSVHSIMGRLSGGTILTRRPFLAPHHTASSQSLVGGGHNPRPGAVSLAHNSVLFLDELTEFRKDVLEALRQPLEDRRVEVSRVMGNVTYPADFLWVSAMNPCPCGYYPDMTRCRCSEHEVRQYLRRISGPLRDRIDIQIEVPVTDSTDMLENRTEESSADIRKRVMAAREVQLRRFDGLGISFNSQMKPAHLQKFCDLKGEEKEYMQQMFRQYDLSSRAYDRIRRVSRTIADLAGKEEIDSDCLAEALYYHVAVRRYWERG